MLRLPTLLPVAIIIASATFGPPACAAELLSNGGFEHGTWEWTSLWGHQAHYVVDDQVHSGKRAMHFASSGAVQSQRYLYRAGPIEVSGWYRIEDVVHGERAYWNWWVSVNFYDAAGENTGHLDVLHAEGTRDWSRFDWRIDAAPEGTREIALVVSLHNCTGRAWLDDVQMAADATLDRTPDSLTEAPHFIGEVLPRPREASYREAVVIWDAVREEPRVRVRLGDSPAPGATLGAELIDFRLTACARYPRMNATQPGEATLVAIDLGRVDDAHILEAARRMGVELPALPPQGHVVRMQRAGDVLRVLAAGADDFGCAYAAASIVQMIGFEGERLVLREFDLTDRPEMLWRANADYGPVGERFLRRMVMHKMSMYAIQHRAWWRLVGPDGGPKYGPQRGWASPLAEMDEFARRTGAIDFMMLVHIYVPGGRPVEQTGPVLNIAGEEDVTELIGRLRWVYEQGVHTLMICVDDYTPAADGEYQFLAPEEAERFRSIGQAHGYLMRRLYAALAPDCPELRLSIVPAPYSLSHLGRQVTEEGGRAYLADMAAEMPDEVAVVWTGPRITSPTITRADWRAYQALVPGQPLYLWDNMQSGAPIPLFAADYYPQIAQDSAWSLMYQNAHFAGWPSTWPAAICANDYMWNPAGYDATRMHEAACHQAWGELNYADVHTVNHGYAEARQLVRGGEPGALVALVGRIYDAVARLEAAGVPMAVPVRSLAAAGATPDIAERLAGIPSAEVARIATPPTIDGLIDEDEWAGATALPAFRRHDTGEALGECFPTQVLLAWDAEALYVACRCEHGDVALHGHENEGRRDGSIFFNSDTIELFLGPDTGAQEYVHLAVDHTNTQYDERRPEGGVNWDARWQSAVVKQPGAWALEVAIPFAELGFGAPAPGERWRANVCRSFGQQSQLSCWAPTWGSFHNFPFFGRLTLGE